MILYNIESLRLSVYSRLKEKLPFASVIAGVQILSGTNELPDININVSLGIAAPPHDVLVVNTPLYQAF